MDEGHCGAERGVGGRRERIVSGGAHTGFVCANSSTIIVLGFGYYDVDTWRDMCREADPIISRR